MNNNKLYLALALCGGLYAASAVPTTSAKPIPKSFKLKATSTKKVTSSLVVQGTVKAIAKTPRPGSVPYKDAVTAIHLNNVKPVSGKLKQSAILVYVWGLRKNKLTPQASYKVGQKIKLSLQPWDKVEGKYGRYQRLELNDEATFNLDAFWGQTAK